jgi:L-aspartate oxidase
VVTDLYGRTSIQGLYACGEVSMTGVHGANRLASNSLLEALVFAQRAADVSRERVGLKEALPEIPPWDESGTLNSEEWVLISHNRREIQEVMWDYVGIVRSRLRLERAQRRLHVLKQEVKDFYDRTRVSEGLIELRNLATVADLIVRSAMLRKESRGLHYTTDHPERDDARWLHDTIISTFDND